MRLSSQAAAAGYRAVLLAALELPRFFPMLTTAAGTVRPARVLVIGAGVAGLQAIATARRLGAIVEGYDVRAAAREQVESLGARFVDTGVGAEGEGGYARELSEDEKRRAGGEARRAHCARERCHHHGGGARPAAPKILSTAMVEGMEAGSVIVDLAAVSGGNCELTRADKTVLHKGVAVLGPTNPAAGLAAHASEMYARNCCNFVTPWFAEKGVLAIPADDEIYRADARRRPRLPETDADRSRTGGVMIYGFIALYIFMLAAFVGYEVISRVPSILHTPLMSGSNFIHGVVLVGAIIALGTAHGPLGRIIGFIAVVLAVANAVGGWVTTERMLAMFKTSKEEPRK